MGLMEQSVWSFLISVLFVYKNAEEEETEIIRNSGTSRLTLK